MITVDRNALICDMAQTYHIYNMYDYKASYIAILACGLEDNSRIKKKIAKTRVGTSDLLLSLILDSLNTLVWFQSEDGRLGINRPKSIYNKLTDNEEYEGVEASDFEDEWIKRGGGQHG